VAYRTRASRTGAPSRSNFAINEFKVPNARTLSDTLSETLSDPVSETLSDPVSETLSDPLIGSLSARSQLQLRIQLRNQLLESLPETLVPGRGLWPAPFTTRSSRLITSSAQICRA
jgi:hypothetical protein